MGFQAWPGTSGPPSRRSRAPPAGQRVGPAPAPQCPLPGPLVPPGETRGSVQSRNPTPAVPLCAGPFLGLGVSTCPSRPRSSLATANPCEQPLTHTSSWNPEPPHGLLVMHLKPFGGRCHPRPFPALCSPWRCSGGLMWEPGMEPGGGMGVAPVPPPQPGRTEAVPWELAPYTHTFLSPACGQGGGGRAGTGGAGAPGACGGLARGREER